MTSDRESAVPKDRAGDMDTPPRPATPPAAQDDTAQRTHGRDDETLDITLFHHGAPHTLFFQPSATLTNLSDRIASVFAIPATHQKLMLTPRPGLLRYPLINPDLALSSLAPPATKKIVLMGTKPSEISSLNEQVHTSQARASRPRPVGAAKPAPRRDWRKTQDEAIYTFTTLRPLPYLPRPERSERFLSRLRDDAGIKAVMARHKWTVPLLTEMDPAAHTTHDGRTLGLNRNGGEVIELRLRTDAYDGYRDYKTIRKTLCHELTHNVHGEHDRQFWDLCKQVEREVESGDWRSGGRAVGEEEFYNPEDGGVGDVDGGGWTGGEFVLGKGSGNGIGGGSGSGISGGGSAISRREILARAAEERVRKQQAVGRGDPPGSAASYSSDTHEPNG